MDSVQTSGSDPLLDRTFTPPRRDQLPSRNNSVLSPGEFRKRAIVIASPRKPSPKNGFRGLGRHPAEVAG